ncbi:MAG: alpha/beta hydrolase fold domain-containing protein, partial [Rhodospirillaceae bacterium]|nr:alpha/beta hydrolase fold domain-containing protein [Rhodospirillaceae bacterium]
MQQMNDQLEEEKTKAATLPDPSWTQMREDYEQNATLFPADPAAEAKALNLGGVPTLCFSGPGADEKRAVLYLHGGGYTIGGLGSHEAITSRLALASQCPVYALDYRLAPEHPFPAAVDDVVSAFRALVAGGLSPSRIAIAGDSAGGGLTVACLLALRDAGDSLPACAVPISPWMDLIGETGWAEADEAIDPMVTISS